MLILVRFRLRPNAHQIDGITPWPWPWPRQPPKHSSWILLTRCFLFIAVSFMLRECVSGRARFFLFNLWCGRLSMSCDRGRLKIRQLIIIFCIKLNASHKIQLVFREKPAETLGGQRPQQLLAATQLAFVVREKKVVVPAIANCLEASAFSGGKNFYSLACIVLHTCSSPSQSKRVIWEQTK